MGLTILAYIIVILYTVALVLILLFSLVQLALLLQYRRWRKKGAQEKIMDRSQMQDWPRVTVQLPVFNELEVAERLIDNIIRLDYPRELVDFQVLDDSTDETRMMIARRVAEYRAQGHDITHLHRENRQGYKAGALRDGMPQAKGEFIAIFDADFLPSPDFLLRTLPYFEDQAVGIVQTRWSHINESYSWLTRLQAFQLNVHFTIEQTGRQSGNLFLQFNGTAGVWRRETIDDAGGWEADTLAEDLDLSYRAQLKGWKVAYRQEITAPAELPAEIYALKSQQFRWMKGGAENARKLAPTILRSHLPLHVKVFALSHLMASSVFLVGLILALLSFPAMVLIGRLGIDLDWYAIFALSLIIAGIVSYVGNRETSWRHWSSGRSMLQFAFRFPFFLAMSMGMSLHNSIAVIEGFRGKASPFVRTPKFNLSAAGGKSIVRTRSTAKLSAATMMEGLLTVYFILAVLTSVRLGTVGFLPYHILLAVGFGTIFFYSVKDLPNR
jgi:cellulose synthase/poly-beta-1,6-N-acetylglucosamine synthase-like glycosyltransferase